MDQDGYDEEILSSTIQTSDYTSAAAGYFGGIRVPATLITGSSLGFLFSFTATVKKSSTTKQRYVVLLRLYHSLVLTSFSLALTTVIIATAASVTILQARHNPIATTPYELLRREFDYEYCVTRWCFLMALFCFIAGVTIKIILEFELLRATRRIHLVAVVSLVLSIVCQALSYVNRTLYSWRNLWEFTRYVFKLVLEIAMDDTKNTPLMMMSIISAMVSMLAMVHITVFSSLLQENKRKEKAKMQ